MRPRRQWPRSASAFSVYHVIQALIWRRLIAANAGPYRGADEASQEIEKAIARMLARR
jgi:hypothetical protein